MKTLILLAAIVIAVLIIRHLLRNRASPPASPPTTDTVRCHYCGLFLTPDQAIEANGHYYCCPEHRDAGHEN